jgi:pimeloyl-ACP methyl ester carboxylesterase
MFMDQLFVNETGSFGAPVILFLHACPLSSRMWQPQLERLRDFHCVAPDLPGHGQSAAIKPMEMREVVKKLADLIRQTSPSDKAHVVGLSYGGVVAQALMLAAPDVVDHVILSGTSTRLNKFLVFLQSLNTPLMRFLKPKQLAGIISSQFKIPEVYQEKLIEDLKDFSIDTFQQVMWSYTSIVTPTKTASPTLVAVGENETPLAKKAALALSSSIHAASGILVPSAAHIWNLQYPDLFADMVRAWVSDQPLPETFLPLI